MELKWIVSDIFPNTYYCGYKSPGTLRKIADIWVWTLYATEGKSRSEVDLGPNLEEAKAVVEALIRLEG